MDPVETSAAPNRVGWEQWAGLVSRCFATNPAERPRVNTLLIQLEGMLESQNTVSPPIRDLGLLAIHLNAANRARRASKGFM